MVHERLKGDNMSNKTYDILKILSMIAGYVATFILTLTDIWGFEYGAAIAATVSGLGILLGSCLKVSTDHYWQNVDEDGDEDE
jgi:hypothetical protein